MITPVKELLQDYYGSNDIIERKQTPELIPLYFKPEINGVL